MTRDVEVINHTRDERLLLRARWCASFACRLRGLMFRRSFRAGQGLVLVQKRASRWDAAIHMLFVFMPLGVVWLDDRGIVIEAVVARPWRFYLPSRPARFVVESVPDLLEFVHPGDLIHFRDA